mgnify:CR=1 FL=1
MISTLRLGIVSDSHGRVESTRAAANLLESFDVSQVIHCGDIGTPEVISALARWPTHYVFGNCDGQLDALRAAMKEAGGTCHEEFGTLKLEGRAIAFLHGDDHRKLVESITSGTFDLVCHGHTHRAKQEMIGETLVLNPGALFRARPLSSAVVELPSLEVTSLDL